MSFQLGSFTFGVPKRSLGVVAGFPVCDLPAKSVPPSKSRVSPGKCWNFPGESRNSYELMELNPGPVLELLILGLEDDGIPGQFVLRWGEA